MLSLIIILFIKDAKSRKEAGKNKIKKTKEDAIAYQPVISYIYKIIKGNQQNLKTADSIIKNLIIEEIQARKKYF